MMHGQTWQRWARRQWCLRDTPGCVLWLRGEVVSLTSGAVQTWTDQNGGAQSFAAAAAGNRPSTTTLNGGTRPALGLNASSNYVRNLHLQSTWLSATEITIYAVALLNSNATNSANIENNPALVADGGQNWGLHLKNGQYVAYIFDSARRTVALNVSNSAAHIFKFRHSGGTLFASLDGGAESSTTAGNMSINSSLVTIGTNGPAAAFVDGTIGEVGIVSGSAVSAIDDANNIAALKRWWGIT